MFGSCSINDIANFHSVLLHYHFNYFREFRDKIDTFNQLLQLQGFYRVCDLKNRKICFESGI